VYVAAKMAFGDAYHGVVGNNGKKVSQREPRLKITGRAATPNWHDKTRLTFLVLVPTLMLTTRLGAR
jgi:hypothetical protein